jgi:protein TonB
MADAFKMALPPAFDKQRSVVFVCVGAVHALLLYAMHTGMSRMADERVQPPVLISEVALLEAAPAPQPTPVPPAMQPTKPKPVLRPAPRPMPRSKPTQAPPILHAQRSQEAQVVTPVQASTQPTAAAEPSAAPALPATGAAGERADKAAPQPAVELPSSNAAYLNNPKPPYPPTSKRLGEQGRVVVRVFIGADGNPGDVEIKKSSGYDRLDQTALDTVKRWRFVPGKRGGVAEAMWFNVPINFVLE